MASALAFPTVNTTVVPGPSSLWSPALTAPFPTNAPWQNFVLNHGNVSEAVGPYSVRVEDSRVSIAHPSRTAGNSSIVQAFVASVIFTVLEGLGSHHVTAYDDLSVTVGWGSTLTLPLVRGSPYITFIVRGGTPAFSSSFPVKFLSSNPNKTRHEIGFDTGEGLLQFWVIYTSAPLALSDGLRASAPFTGIIRVARLADTLDPNAWAVLDYYSPVYPTGGAARFGSFGVVYRWQTASWAPETVPAEDLLMLSLRTHRQVLSTTSGSQNPETRARQMVTRARQLAFWSIDGPMTGQVGATWTLQDQPVAVGWYSVKGISSAAGRTAVIAAVKADIAALEPIATSSSYFFGKAAARAARLALIAEEVGLSAEVDEVAAFLRAALSPWLGGTAGGNALLYDAAWGGITTEAGTKSIGGDFGVGVYNDHHFHYGYLLYAAAVLVKLDSAWGRRYKAPIYALLDDYMTVTTTQAESGGGSKVRFPRLRHFDAWALHSWASGVTEFADGRNQESSSEAVNAYYAASLVGLAFGDLPLATLGATLGALEARSARNLWHVPENSTLYDPAYVAANRVVGIVWANKRDSGLWFAPAADLEIRVGIQVLPLTPYTEALFPNARFARQLVEWATPALSRAGVTDQWRGFLWALEAIYNSPAAVAKIRALAAFDDGNSLSNMLWWAYSR